MKFTWFAVGGAAAAAAIAFIALRDAPPAGAAAAPQHAHHATAETDEAAPAMKTPTVIAAPEGRLWRAWVEHGHVFVNSSGDLGRTYDSPRRINPEPAEIDSNGEGRPKIVLGPGGEIYVSYTRSGRRPYTGDIQFTRSFDGGRTFDPPRTINDDGLDTGHRFDALAVGADGTIYVVWIDKRDLERATSAEKEYGGAALYYAVSRDRGATFAPNRKIKDHTCECCRIAHAFDADGRLVLFWRDLMDGSIRDHAMTWIAADGTIGPIRRVTADNWVLDACPHHGPALAMGPAGVMHVVWFTGEGPRGPGAFYGRLDADGRLEGEPRRLGPAHPGTGHADLAVDGERVTVVWKESRSPGTAVMTMTSTDGGRSFDTPREMASTSRGSDHPMIVRTPVGLHVSWFSATDGHRVLPIAPGT
jgi:hypothetical protein